MQLFVCSGMIASLDVCAVFWRRFIHRFYDPVEKGSLSWNLASLFQGASPETWAMGAGEYTVHRFANLYGLTYLGMATKEYEADVLAAKIG